MSVIDYMGKRRIAVVGVGFVAVSLFGATAPAVAVGASRITLTSSTPTVGIGGLAKLKAVVKPVDPLATLKPTGTVTFREGTTVAGTVTLALVGTVQVAKLETTTLPVGSHTFIATYNGSTDYATSGSLPVTIVVAKSATTTTGSTSTPAPAPGQDAKLKAVVKQGSGTIKPTGTVTFTEGATNYGSVALALVGTVETAKLTVPGLALGNHVITATYSGSTTFNASSSTVTVAVAKGNTTSMLTAAPVVGNPGKSTLAVAVAPVAPAKGVPTGTVTFVVDTNAPQVFSLNAAGKVQFSVSFVVGTTHSVRVTYAGDSLFNGSTGTLNFTS